MPLRTTLEGSDAGSPTGVSVSTGTSSMRPVEARSNSLAQQDVPGL
jgi:hypothetical protein